ncbi:MAG: LamG-like jellyroll fold domain-containing protein [Planctomycetota bacterium]
MHKTTITLAALATAFCGYAQAAVVTDNLVDNFPNANIVASGNWASSTNGSQFDVSGDNDAVFLGATGSSTTLTQAYTFGSGTGNNGVEATVARGGGTQPSFSSVTGLDVSVELWARPTDLLGAETLFESGGSGAGYTIALNGSTLVAFAKEGSAAEPQTILKTTLSAPMINDFVQIVFTSSGTGTADLYVNGQSVATDVTAASSIFGTDRATLGGARNPGGGGAGADLDVATTTYNNSQFFGEIGLFRFYDDVLTAAEVADNYAAVAAIPEPTSVAAVGLLGLQLLRRRRV